VRSYRLWFTGSPAWLVVLAIISFPIGCAAAFLYLLCNFRVEVSEQPKQAQ
jgi:hypothetical protein